MESPSKMVKLAAGRKLFSLFTAQKQILWLVDDEYLLLLTKSGYSEKSKRLYLPDIQSISHAPTSEGVVAGVGLIGLASVLLLVGLWSIGELGLTGGLLVASLSLFPFFWMIRGALRGGTCKCLICTAVSSELVVALNRKSVLEQVLLRLMPKIDQAQGRLTTEMLQSDATGEIQIVAGAHAVENMQPAASGIGGQTVNIASVQDDEDIVQNTATLSTPSMRVYASVFGLAIFIAILNLSDIFLPMGNSPRQIMDALFFVVLLSVTIMLLVQQRRYAIYRNVKQMVKVLMAMEVLSFGIGMVIGMVFGFSYIFSSSPESITSGYSSFYSDMQASWVFQVHCIFTAIVLITPSVLGLLRLQAFADAVKQARKGSAP